ncbi:MAG: glycoside hydrolase family 88 protein, partial [Bacteroidales bacterium]|nr:glycoside hydrolase family 88 protein [Bacteroidales bacterium]
MAAALFEVIDFIEYPQAKEYLDTTLAYTKNKQDRLSDGTFCRKRFEYTSLWGDDLYMSVPYLVRAGNIIGD